MKTRILVLVFLSPLITAFGQESIAIRESKALIQRVLEKHTNDFLLKEIPTENGRDVFKIALLSKLMKELGIPDNELLALTREDNVFISLDQNSKLQISISNSLRSDEMAQRISDKINQIIHALVSLLNDCNTNTEAVDAISNHILSNVESVRTLEHALIK